MCYNGPGAVEQLDLMLLSHRLAFVEQFLGCAVLYLPAAERSAAGLAAVVALLGDAQLGLMPCHLWPPLSIC